MTSEDYIIRLIRQAMAVLARIIGYKNAGQYQQAFQSIDQALELVFGMNAETVRLLDDASLHSLLEKNDSLDGEHLELIADIFKEAGDLHRLQDQTAASVNSYLRSLHYYLMIRKIAGTAPAAEMSQKIDGLLQWLGAAQLDEDSLWDLYGHFEHEHEFAKAEGMLMNLAVRKDSRADALNELRLFYQRLLELDPRELSAAGLDPTVIRKKLNS